MKDFYEYCERVKKYPFLKYRQLMELLSTKCDCDVKTVVECYQRLVCSLVRNWLENARRYGVSPMDLVQAGNIGLQMAIESFNCGRGRGFFSYAKDSIKSYIECEFYKHTVHYRLKGKKLAAQHEEERKKNMLLCKETEPLNLYPVTYLSQVIGEDEEGNPLKFEDVLPDEEMDRWQLKLEVNGLLKFLKKTNGKIHHLAPEIIQLRNGIGKYRGSKPLTLKETAIVVHMSPEWVRKINGKAMEYLKSEFCSVSDR
ncbi:MAG: hypothetical protein HY919_07415 [Elusimicrobia bacterium]|nr:hypothetical protein [Elusimicrobiota bacterium]